MMSEDEMKDENEAVIAPNDLCAPDLKISQSTNTSNENTEMVKEIHQVVFQPEVPKSPSTSDMPYTVNRVIDFPSNSCGSVDNNEISALQDETSMNESNSKSVLSLEENEDVNTDISNGHQSEPGKYEFRVLSIHYVKGKGGRKTYKCDVCGGTYKHAFSLKRHYLRTHINYDYLSEADISNCNISTQLSSTKKLNIIKSQNSPKEECKEKKNVPNEDDNSVAMPGLYRCHVCYQLFNELQELKYHVANHPDQPNNKRFPCNQCDMTFSHRQNLVRHLSVHSGEKPYACRYCGKCFPTATNQKRHERIHEGVKPYECSHCSSLFTQSGDLKKHIRKQHIEFFHPCAFCLKYFSTEENLEEHVISHGESLESNYKLTNKKLNVASPKSSNKTNIFCSQAIKKSTLKNSVEWRYHCNICWKRFNSYVILCRHKRSVHSNMINQSRCAKAAIKYSNAYSAKCKDDVLLQNPPSTEADFYADIAYNISDNLLNHLDGKIYEIQQQTLTAEKPIETSTAEQQCSKGLEDQHLPLSFYNFPPDFHFDEEEDSVADSEDDQLGNVGFNLTTPKNKNVSSGESHESNSLSHSEMMHTLSLSPVNSDGSGEIQCIDGVLDLSVSNKNRNIPKEPEKINTCEVILPKLFLCYACGENFSSFEDIENHKLNNHPNVLCNHLELEGVKDVPLDIFKHNHSSIGLLKNCIVPPTTGISDKIICTKCQCAFETVFDLHSHMLDCGGYVHEQNTSKSNNMHSYRRKKSGKRGMKRKLEDTPQKKNVLTNIIKKPKKEVEKQLIYPEKSISPKGNPQEKEVFACDGCDRKFNYPSGLERHKKCCSQKLLAKKQERSKDIRQQHSCPNCSRSFTYLASLKKHVSDCISQTETKTTKRLKLNNLSYGNNYEGHSESSNNTKISSFDSSSAENSDSNSKEIESKYKEASNSPTTSAEDVSVTEIHVKCEAKEMTEEEFEKEIQQETDSLAQEENSEEQDDDLPPADAKEEEKSEPNSHSCPNCQRTYTYLANFKKHVKDACPLRKEFLKSDESKASYSDNELSQENSSSNLKSEVFDKEENETIDCAEEMENGISESESVTKGPVITDEGSKVNSKDNDKRKARIQTFNCPICHRIFFSYVKLLQHQLSHKLNSTDKQDEDETDKNFICQYCQNAFKDKKQYNLHINLCSKNNSHASKAQTKISSVKHKGGWPKGKSRKGYIPKHKRIESELKNNTSDDNTVKTKDKKKLMKNGKYIGKNSKLNVVTKTKGNKKDNSVSRKRAQVLEVTSERESSNESSCSNKISLEQGHNKLNNNAIRRDQLTEYRSGILRRMKRSAKRRPKKSVLPSKIIKTEPLTVGS